MLVKRRKNRWYSRSVTRQWMRDGMTCRIYHDIYNTLRCVTPQLEVTIKGSDSILFIQKFCFAQVGTAAHELAHAMGFFHMQSRYDRDDYITLYTQNFLVNLRYTSCEKFINKKPWLQNGWLSQFTKQTERTNNNYNLSYDYGGVMHYGATGFVMSSLCL